jgi:hypothetical protein
MADVSRSSSALLTTLFQDGQSAGISAQDLRDLLVSLMPAYGGLYFSTPAATTIGSGGTYVKAAGTTTATTATADVGAGGASNRLIYTGVVPRHFHVTAAMTLTPASGTNQSLGVQVYVYDDSAATGAVVAASKANAFDAATNGTFIATQANVTLDTDDYVEVWITNETGAVNVTATLGVLFMQGLIV